MIKIFVFDTNSLISANLLPGSVNRKAYDRAREIGIPVYSDTTFAEFAEVFTRPKFDKYLSAQNRLQLMILSKKRATYSCFFKCKYLPGSKRQ